MNMPVTYYYDVLGRIYSRFDNNSGMYYIYDGLNLVADYDYYEDRIVRTYTYGPGIDNIQSMTVYDANGDSETYYYMKDISNTVLSLMGADGIVVEFYRYDAFGNVTIYDNPTWAIIPESAYGNRFLFQGREYDYKTQLYNFRARWYDPETGRWLSNDPIGISGGLNLYAFCGNNPVCFVDPMGFSFGIYTGLTHSIGGDMRGQPDEGLDVGLGKKLSWLLENSGFYGALAGLDALYPLGNLLEPLYKDKVDSSLVKAGRIVSPTLVFPTIGLLTMDRSLSAACYIVGIVLAIENVVCPYEYDEK